MEFSPTHHGGPGGRSGQGKICHDTKQRGTTKGGPCGEQDAKRGNKENTHRDSHRTACRPHGGGGGGGGGRQGPGARRAPGPEEDFHAQWAPWSSRKHVLAWRQGASPVGEMSEMAAWTVVRQERGGRLSAVLQLGGQAGGYDGETRPAMGKTAPSRFSRVGAVDGRRTTD
ncbi:hypothetical protein VTO42DRAFT_4083 [Malbranchea cinnamomea]